MLVSFSSLSVYSNSFISDFMTRSLISWHLKTLKTLLNVIQNTLVILTFHLMQCLEIQSMNALVLSGLGRSAESMALIKKALFKNLSNFTCWHVYGIIHRQQKDYETAKKAYINAHKHNASNDSILRDLCQLQIHSRDYTGFAETRRLMLVKDPSVRENWVAYAVASYLSADYNTCLSSVDSILRIF